MRIWFRLWRSSCAGGRVTTRVVQRGVMTACDTLWQLRCVKNHLRCGNGRRNWPPRGVASAVRRLTSHHAVDASKQPRLGGHQPDHPALPSRQTGRRSRSGDGLEDLRGVSYQRRKGNLLLPTAVYNQCMSNYGRTRGLPLKDLVGPAKYLVWEGIRGL